MHLSDDERTLLLLYYDETRTGTLANLRKMSAELQADEEELRNLTDAVIRKLEALTENEFQELGLFEGR